MQLRLQQSQLAAAMETRRGRNQRAEELREAERKWSWGLKLWRELTLLSLRALMLWRELP